MINTEVLLRYKISVTESLYGYGHTRIQITNNGRGIVVEELTSKEFREILENNDKFIKVPKEKYNYRDGDIYHDNKFRPFMNRNPHIKERLYKILDSDNE